MFKKILMIGVPFIAGALVGAVGAAIFVKKKFQKLFDEKIIELEESYNEKLNELNKMADDLENMKKTAEEKVPEPTKEEAKAFRQRKSSDHYTQYSKVNKKKEETPDWAEVKQEEYKRTEPYIIDEDMHYDSEPTYKLEELVYNSTMQCLYYLENGEQIDMCSEVDILIGIHNLNTFLDSEEDMLYVRNDNTNTDYCISKNNMP